MLTKYMLNKREKFALFVSRIPFRIPFEDQLDLLLMYKVIKPQYYKTIERGSFYLHKNPQLYMEFKEKYLGNPKYFISHNRNDVVYLYKIYSKELNPIELNSSFVPKEISEL
jgi:hypothetical protein